MFADLAFLEIKIIRPEVFKGTFKGMKGLLISESPISLQLEQIL
jgi:hypothetical protein